MPDEIVVLPPANSPIRGGVEALFRQSRVIGVIAAVVSLATLGVTFLMPKLYVSRAKFLVQNARENVVLTPERTGARTVVSGVSEEQVNSEVEILRSRDVIDSIADPNWIQASQHNSDEISAHETALERFYKRFGTEIVRKTNVIDVSLVARSPERAKADLEKIASSYLALRRHLQRPAGSSDFFAAEAEKARNEWNDANQRLIGFQNEHQTLNLDERKLNLNDIIAENERDELTTETTLREIDVKLAESVRQMNAMAPRQATEDKVVPNLQSVQELTTLLVQLKNNRTALLTRFPDSDRVVREVDQQIATTKAALESAFQNESHEKSTDVDPAWQQVRTNYVQTQIAKRIGIEHRAKIEAQNLKLHHDLDTLQGLTIDFDNLQEKANQLKANYELYAEKRDQAHMEDAMDERNLANVAVVQKPTLNFTQERPRVLMSLVLGFVTACFLGISAGYLADVSRGTIATPRELELISRYPVLATVPLVPKLILQAPISEFRISDGRPAEAD